VVSNDAATCLAITSLAPERLSQVHNDLGYSANKPNHRSDVQRFTARLSSKEIYRRFCKNTAHVLLSSYVRLLYIVCTPTIQCTALYPYSVWCNDGAFALDQWFWLGADGSCTWLCRWGILLLSLAVVLHCAMIIVRSGPGVRFLQECCLIIPNAEQLFLENSDHDFPALACLLAVAFM
jgi:hypothetical protein